MKYIKVECCKECKFMYLDYKAFDSVEYSCSKLLENDIITNPDSILPNCPLPDLKKEEL